MGTTRSIDKWVARLATKIQTHFGSPHDFTIGPNPHLSKKNELISDVNSRWMDTDHEYKLLACGLLVVRVGYTHVTIRSPRVIQGFLELGQASCTGLCEL